MSIYSKQPTRSTPGTNSTANGVTRLLLIFGFSGVAALIYEVVWFQLLRLTIGVSAQSLGILLACFMGGLFLGSLGYARLVPQTWNPMKTYAVMELIIGLTGLLMPTLIGSFHGIYLSNAHSPQMAFFLRVLVCIILLLPPTILMGATLPALSRWVKTDERQARHIGRLYAVNIIGAVAGAFGAAFFLMPKIEFSGTNYVAVGLNLVVAIAAWTLGGSYTYTPESESKPTADDNKGDRFPIYLAYFLNGAASLSFEVVWSRMLGMAFGATVYAFAMVLGVFLLGLGLGAGTGAQLGKRLKRPLLAFAALQLCIAAAVGATNMLVPAMALSFGSIDASSHANELIWSLVNLVRTAVVVFPGAFLWGMSFPFALVCLGPHLSDAAKPVGTLYAYNTVGAVLGSLATSFILFPYFGSATATAHLILLPICTAVVLMLPPRRFQRLSVVLTAAAMLVVYATPWPSNLNKEIDVHVIFTGYIYLILGALFFSAVVFAFFRRRSQIWWAFIAAFAGVACAYADIVPKQLYMLGRGFASRQEFARTSMVELFEEGTTEPVVVFWEPANNSLQVSINSKVCATSLPQDMVTQRLLGLIPVLFSMDPGHSVVVGLGAGVTAGAVTLSQAVKQVDIVELEPKVKLAARAFHRYNNGVMDSPKANIIIDDGRHYIAASEKKYGVITSDPVDPWIAGAAALYTVEYFKHSREHLIEGGVFMKWLGMYDLDEKGTKSILAAFAEAFPDGGLWITPVDLLLVGSTGPLKIDVPALRKRLSDEPQIAQALREVGIPSAEVLLGCYLAPCRSMNTFLSGAVANRDRNLFVQFTGGFSVYDSQNWITLREMLAGLRTWDKDIFQVPPDEKNTFRKTIEAEWQKYQEMIPNLRQEYVHQGHRRRP